MKQKSKFTTFLLSFIPGLSHFYLGYPERGLIYLIIFGAIGLGSFIMAMATSNTIFILLFVVGESLIWLIALIDAFSTINNTPYINPNEDLENENQEKKELENKKVIALALSIIPGAGHMYLGYQEKGLIIMGSFFFTIFFMGWLNLSVLLFLLPLIWFYSFFDAFHTLNGKISEDINMERLMPIFKPRYIGLGLIGLGVLSIFQKILYPVFQDVLYKFFDGGIAFRINNYIQTGIVSIIFIIGGIKLLKSNKEVEDKEDIEVEIIEEEE